MGAFLTILAILAAVALTFIVIIQNSKGGGLSSTFGAASGASQILGARRSSDLVEKLTWYLAGTLTVLCFLATVASKPDAPKIGLEMDRSDVAGYTPSNLAPTTVSPTSEEDVIGGEALEEGENEEE